MYHSFGDFWAAKQRANPQLGTVAEGSMSLSYDSFRRELEKAYLAGVASGVSSTKHSSSASNLAAMLGVRSLMERIFGKDEFFKDDFFGFGQMPWFTPKKEETTKTEDKPTT